MNGIELLASFRAAGSEDAFHGLVDRYAALVYSVAKRRLFSEMLAEEVSQDVFTRLAGTGAHFKSDAELAGWLHRTTIHVSIDLLRSEIRRDAREREAAAMQPTHVENEMWNEISPVLDEALDRLHESDRHALLLRFFEGKSMREVGVNLGIQEDAAKMRVGRALEKLRSRLVRSGATCSVLVLGTVLAERSVASVPGTVISALHAMKTPAVGTASLGTGLSQLFNWKMAIGAVAVAGLIGWMVLSSAKKPTAEKPMTVATPLETPASIVKARIAAHSAAQNQPKEAETKTLLIRVVDADTLEPIAGATVSTWTNRLTAADGTYLLKLPKFGSGDFFYRIKISKTGYVARYVSWSKYQKDNPEDMPAEYTTKLGRAATIGGVVKNEKGEGIPGAKIVFTGPSPSGISDRDRTTVMGNFHTEVSDSNGAWICNEAPLAVTNLQFEVQHPEYLSASFICEAASMRFARSLPVTAASLLATNSVMVLKPGIRLAGLITDTAGAPVIGARITQSREWYNAAATLTNGVDGRFSILNAGAGDLMLTIQARHFAAQTVIVTTTNTPEVTIVMQPGKILRGKVIDEAGMPISNAVVELERINYRPAAYQWTGRTDGVGEFLWDSAPEEANPYSIDAPGFGLKRFESWIADGQPKIVVMNKWKAASDINLVGNVIDAVTQYPIKNFKLHLEEITDGGGVSPFNRDFSNDNGEYKVPVNAVRFTVEIEAEGYVTAKSSMRTFADGNQRIDFSLNKPEKKLTPSIAR